MFIIKTIIITVLLWASSNNLFAQTKTTTKDNLRRKKVHFFFDALKLPTLTGLGKDYNNFDHDVNWIKPEIGARYFAHKYFYLAGNIGYGFKKNRDGKEESWTKTSGKYFKLGLGYKPNTDQEDFEVYLGYNLGYSVFKSQKFVDIYDNFWNENNPNAIVNDRKYSAFFHEIYGSIKYNLLKSKSFNLFIEPSARIRTCPSSNHLLKGQFVPGYGRLSYTSRCYIALNLNFGIEF